jgi:hypothetical protein
MKKLISQFRKFPSFNSLRTNENFSFAVIVATITFGASCQLARKGSDESKPASAPQAESTSGSLDVTPPLAPDAMTYDEQAVWLDLFFKQGDEEVLIGQILDPECGDTPAAAVTLSITAHSAFGTHKALLSVRGNDTSETVRATIDQASMGFTSSAPIKSRINTRACAARQAGQERVEITRDTFDQIREYLEAISPDCESIKATKDGWFCKVPTVDPESAKQELIGVRTTMIRRWSRQPYLIARRLAIGIQIANALQSDSVEHELDTFCRIVKENLPQEIPVVMTSLRWQNTLCKKDSPYRIEAAMFGLAKTISEVDFIRQLFESTSKLGTLTVRLPRDASPSGQFFVQLKPESGVNEDLVQASLKLWRTDAANDDAQKACWHPLFMETPRLMAIARNLAMAGDSTKAICHATLTASPGDGFVERYLADSITSETEFVISNGRSKLLRLPTGAYSYTLHALPENPDDWDDASLTSNAATGIIEWTPKRPRPVISSWISSGGNPAAGAGG